MTELKSSLPFEEVKAAQTMVIYPVTLSECSYIRAKLNFIVDDEPIVANLYSLEDEKALGYLPSKTWSSDGITLLYYLCESLPVGARPFGKAKLYCFTTPLTDKPIEYDANWRVWIDQVQTKAGMLLIVIFGEDQYQDVVNEVL